MIRLIDKGWKLMITCLRILKGRNFSKLKRQRGKTTFPSLNFTLYIFFFWKKEIINVIIKLSYFINYPNKENVLYDFPFFF